MKFVVYGPERRVGALVGDQVIDVNRAYAKYLREKQGEARPNAMAAAVVPSDLAGLIESGARGLEGVQQALDHLGSAQDKEGVGGATIVRPAGSVKLMAPMPGPGSRIACGGANFAKHSAGIMSIMSGKPTTEKEVHDRARSEGLWGFWKLSRGMLNPDDAMSYPKRTERLDYEGEVAILLNKPLKDASEAQARQAVWGVTLFVDWSIRDGGGVPRAMSFNLGKNFDGSASLGPCVVVGEVDPENLEVETRLNGELRQQYSTAEMIYTFPEILAYLSRDFTFLPGDIITGGTGAGTALDSSPKGADGKQVADRFVKPGDVLEVSSPKIGVLRNRVTARSGEPVAV